MSQDIIDTLPVVIVVGLFVVMLGWLVVESVLARWS